MLVKRKLGIFQSMLPLQVQGIKDFGFRCFPPSNAVVYLFRQTHEKIATFEFDPVEFFQDVRGVFAGHIDIGGPRHQANGPDGTLGDFCQPRNDTDDVAGHNFVIPSCVHRKPDHTGFVRDFVGFKFGLLMRLGRARFADPFTEIATCIRCCFGGALFFLKARFRCEVLSPFGAIFTERGAFLAGG